MKQHRFWAWGAVICMIMVMVTGYQKEIKERKYHNECLHKTGLLCGRCVIGSFGIKLLSSKDAKKAYVHVAAAGLRMKDSVMETATTVQENAADILASAKDLNEARAAKEAEELLLPIWKAKKPDIRRGSRLWLLFLEGGAMNATILHESHGRIRLRLRQKQMSLAQADLLRRGSRESPVWQVTVHERTCCVILHYDGTRQTVLDEIRRFSWTEAEPTTHFTRPQQPSAQPRI